MNASGCAAARRSLPGSLSKPTYLFSGMFLNSIKSGVTVGKVNAGILGGSDGVNEAAGGSQFLNNGCKILIEDIGLTYGISNYLTFNKYTLRAGLRMIWLALLNISTLIFFLLFFNQNSVIIMFCSFERL